MTNYIPNSMICVNCSDREFCRIKRKTNYALCKYETVKESVEDE